MWPTPLEWLFLLLVGITAQGGQVFLTRGLQREPAGKATAIGYLQVVFAGLWGAVFFGELPLQLAKADYESRLKNWEEWQPVAVEAQG